ncbi:MAG TPA: ABC transporter permease [Acidimicrobiales bacterium]|nr:ABC transporter permease [Acidimicrobiales bacterium]
MPSDDFPGRSSAEDFGSPWARSVAEEDAIPGQAIPPSVAVGHDGEPEGGEAVSAGGAFRQIALVFRENKLAVAGLAVIVVMILFCVVGPVVYPTNQTNAQEALQTVPVSPPTAPGKYGHPLGTDDNGFDVLGRLMWAGRNSLLIGFVAAFMATVFGVIYGAASGFVGGSIDALMMRIVDVLLSIPQLFLLIVLAVIFRPSLSLLILVIAFVAWLVPARLIRGETLTLRTREYVQAVRVMGGNRRRIVFRHIIPNSVGTIVVNVTFQVADAILLLAALGFLGLGLPAPRTDWGAMLSNGVNYVYDGYWWLIYPAGFCIIIVVMSFNYVGDAMRDALEVRLQKR